MGAADYTKASDYVCVAWTDNDEDCGEPCVGVVRHFGATVGWCEDHMASHGVPLAYHSEADWIHRPSWMDNPIEDLRQVLADLSSAQPSR